MKNLIKLFLQNILGFNNYLYIFSIFKIFTLKFDKDEGVFLNLLKLLSDDSVVLDIGANIGIMTILLAKKCNKGKVFAFEPIEDNFNALQRVLKFFKIKNTIAEKIALGNKDQTVKMILPTKNFIKLQGLPHVITSPDSQEEGIKYDVRQKTLDSFWNNREDKINAIKIDVENYESEVFEGAINLLTKYMPIIYAELWNNANRSRSFELLTKLGYKIMVFIEGSFVDFDQTKHNVDNFFFFPDNQM